MIAGQRYCAQSQHNLFLVVLAVNATLKPPIRFVLPPNLVYFYFLNTTLRWICVESRLAECVPKVPLTVYRESGFLW